MSHYRDQIRKNRWRISCAEILDVGKNLGHAGYELIYITNEAVGHNQSVGNTRLVGAEIAQLVKFIINKTGGSKHLADRFYIIGFSLGGQIVGYAGKSLRDKGMLLGRITGKSREY